jgi:hypothetical protein
MRITQYINHELDDDEQRIVEYLWYQEYDNFIEQYNDDMTFDEFQEHLFGHILGSVVNILMKTEKNINLLKDMYFAMTGKDAEEEEIDTSKLIFPKDITDAKICEECGEYDESCGWASNEKETYFTYCCRFCDVDGSKYNDWAETEKNNLYTFDKQA